MNEVSALPEPEVKESEKTILKKLINISPDSSFFPVFQKLIKQVESGTETRTIKVLNQVKSAKLRQQSFDFFEFNFDWQSEDICGIDVYKIEESINEH